MRLLRRILDIKWIYVRDEMIMNKSVHLKLILLKNPNSQKNITIRWKNNKNNKYKVPGRLISSRINKKTNRKTEYFYHAFNTEIILPVDRDGHFNSRVYLVLDNETWSMLTKSLGYDNNLDYDKWNDDFRNNFSHSSPSRKYVLYFLITS